MTPESLTYSGGLFIEPHCPWTSFLELTANACLSMFKAEFIIVQKRVYTSGRRMRSLDLLARLVSENLDLGRVPTTLT